MALSPIRQSWTFARAFFDELDSIIIVTVLITITTLLCTTLSYQTYCRRGPSNEPPDGPAHRDGHVVGLGVGRAHLHSGNCMMTKFATHLIAQIYLQYSAKS